MENKVRVSLSRDLRKRYGIRSFPVSVGDIVTIRTGSRKGEGGKVAGVNHKTSRISVDGITVSKADGKQEEYLLPSNIFRITKLDLSSPLRLQRIRDLAARKNIVVEEEPEPEPETEEETQTLEGEEVTEEQLPESGAESEVPEAPEAEESEGEEREEAEETMEGSAEEEAEAADSEDSGKEEVKEE